MDILLTLRTPGRLFVGKKGHIESGIEGALLDSEMMPWPMFTDILVSARREFIGLSLYSGKKYALTAQRMAEVCDPRIVKFISEKESSTLPRYKKDTIESDYFCGLELRWSSVEPASVEVAQLVDDWYDCPDLCKNSTYPYAYGYSGIDDILDTYNITIPSVHY